MEVDIPFHSTKWMDLKKLHRKPIYWKCALNDGYLQELRDQQPVQPLRNWMSPVLRRVYFQVPLKTVVQCVNVCYYQCRRHYLSCLKKQIFHVNFLFHIYFLFFSSEKVKNLLNIYLSDPLPSFPPKYLMSWSPTESLLCSSDGKLWLLQTSSIGSDLTLSFKRFGGDGVRLSLSVDDEDRPLPFDALLLLKLFGSVSNKD